MINYLFVIFGKSHNISKVEIKTFWDWLLEVLESKLFTENPLKNKHKLFSGFFLQKILAA